MKYVQQVMEIVDAPSKSGESVAFQCLFKPDYTKFKSYQIKAMRTEGQPDGMKYLITCDGAEKGGGGELTILNNVMIEEGTVFQVKRTGGTITRVQVQGNRKTAPQPSRR